MGTWWPATAIENLMTDLPSTTILVLDEAYCDTAPPGTVSRVDVNNPQVVRYRTFSKAYGLAGARIGYALGAADVIEGFEKVRNHYGVNRVGQIGALASLQDQTYLKDVVTRIDAARLHIVTIALANGLKPLTSAASFVAIDCGRDGEFARRLLDELIKSDVFVRQPSASGIDRCIRVSCSHDADLAVFAEELPSALAAAKAVP
jgi:histidinol-phosphate aminotransferase